MIKNSKFNNRDLVYKNSAPTWIGVVYSCDSENTMVSWGGAAPVSVKTEWLIKSNYTQAQIHLMQDIVPNLFLFITEIDSALSDKSTLSIWETSVKEQCEKFINIINNS